MYGDLSLLLCQTFVSRLACQELRQGGVLYMLLTLTRMRCSFMDEGLWDFLNMSSTLSWTAEAPDNLLMIRTYISRNPQGTLASRDIYVVFVVPQWSRLIVPQEVRRIQLAILPIVGATTDAQCLYGYRNHESKAPKPENCVELSRCTKIFGVRTC